MEEKKHMCEVCRCYEGECAGHYHRPFRFLRWIFGLAIIFIVFGVGMKIGEFKGEIENNYGYGYGGYRMMRFDRPMMYGFYGDNVDQAIFTSPQSVTQPTTKK